MTNRSQASKNRGKFGRDKQAMLFKKVKAAQRRLYSKILEVLTGLDTDSKGRIKFTAKNLRKVDKIVRVVEKFNLSDQVSIGNWIGKRIDDLLGLNKVYFKTLKSFDFETLDSHVRGLTMSRIGFDQAKGKLRKGGWLDQLTNDKKLARDVAGQINAAIAAKTGLTDFRDQFRNVFLSPSPQGLGMLERHYFTNTFDIFQQYDRQIGLTYADELELNFAVYSGTIKKTTRPFCVARTGQIFTREEIESWSGLSFAGKSQPYNPFTDLGGFNCRHSLDWITDEIAETIKSRRDG